MKYLGGKHGIGKKISLFISQKCPNNSVNGYIEPFCGSLGVFKQMTNKNYKKYIASDIHPDLIELWEKLQKNKLKLPNEINEEDYINIKNSKSPNYMKAVAGFGLSFGGKYFAGYAQKSAGTSGRNFLQEFKNSMEKIKPLISGKNIHFYNKSYLDYNPTNMLIYCDPPYKSTEKYASTEDFNHDLFWETMRKWSRNNCVFISEQSAPSDFKSVWSLNKRRTLDKTSRFYNKEHLFVYTKSKQYITKKNKTINNKTRKNKKV